MDEDEEWEEDGEVEERALVGLQLLLVRGRDTLAMCWRPFRVGPRGSREVRVEDVGEVGDNRYGASKTQR